LDKLSLGVCGEGGYFKCCRFSTKEDWGRFCSQITHS